jgi:hypothetical protein
VCAQHESFGAIQERFAMTRGDSDASFCVERDDRRSVKPSTHRVVCATFFYLSPLYGESDGWSSIFPERQQVLSFAFARGNIEK